MSLEENKNEDGPPRLRRGAIVLVLGLVAGLSAWIATETYLTNPDSRPVVVEDGSRLARANSAGSPDTNASARSSVDAPARIERQSPKPVFRIEVKWLTMAPDAADLLHREVTATRDDETVFGGLLGVDGIEFENELSPGRYLLKDLPNVAFYNPVVVSAQGRSAAARPTTAYAGFLVAITTELTCDFESQDLYLTVECGPQYRIPAGPDSLIVRAAAIQCTQTFLARIGEPFTLLVPRSPTVFRLGPESVARFSIENRKELEGVVPHAGEKILLQLARKTLINVRLIEGVPGEWVKFVDAFRERYILHMEKKLRDGLAMRRRKGWDTTAEIRIKARAPENPLYAADALLERTKCETLAERSGVVAEGVVSLSLTRTDRHELLVTIEFDIGPWSPVVAVALATIETREENVVDLHLGNYFESVWIAVEDTAGNRLPDQAIAVEKEWYDPTRSVGVRLERIPTPATNSDGLIELCHMIFPKDTSVRISKEPSIGVQTLAEYISRASNGSHPAIVLRVLDEFIDRALMRIQITCNFESTAVQAIGRYHIVPGQGNPSLEVDSGQFATTGTTALTTRIRAPGRYHILMIGTFGVIYREFEFDGTSSAQATIEPWQSQSVLLPSGEAADYVAFPRSAPQWVCWSLLHRWEGSEATAFPFHVLRNGREHQLRTQPGAAQVSDYWFWTGQKPYRYVSGTQTGGGALSEEELCTVSIKLPTVTAPEVTAYILVATPVYSIGKEADSALVMYGHEQIVRSATPLVEVLLPEGTYWIALLAQRESGFSIAGATESGALTHVTKTKLDVELVPR